MTCYRFEKRIRPFIRYDTNTIFINLYKWEST